MRRPFAWILGTLAIAICASASSACVVSPAAVSWTPTDPNSRICHSGSVLECRAVCDSGDVDACYALAQMYKDGHRVPQDTGRALALLDRACNADLAAACTQLGLTWTDVDDARAVVYFERGCRDGTEFACTSLLRRLDANPSLLPMQDRIALLHKLCAHSAESDACGRLKDLGVEQAEASR